MSIHLDNLLTANKVLLLQGPMGGFFNKLAQWLSRHNIDCVKLNLNGGDYFFSRGISNRINYQGTLDKFDEWLEKFILDQGIDVLVCFGDCRLYHCIAKKVSSKLKVKFFAFEEGYIRPDYITFEQEGVNFYSRFSKDVDLKSTESINDTIQPIKEVNNQFSLMVRSAIFYYIFTLIFKFKYPHYKHHRNISSLGELYGWSLSGIRRVRNYIFENYKFNQFIGLYSNRYFIFALQVHNDSQIHTHSDLKSVERYIQLVVESFSKYAEPQHLLVLKHHPMDRGYRNYTKLIDSCAKKYNIEGRLHYFCDIHFPTLLKNSLGMVTVNSTTGLQALFHHIPVKALGHAIYNIPGLTNQVPLKLFWKNPGQVDIVYFNRFKTKLINYSQLNGSFYGESPWMYEGIRSCYRSIRCKGLEYKRGL